MENTGAVSVSGSPAAGSGSSGAPVLILYTPGHVWATVAPVPARVIVQVASALRAGAPPGVHCPVYPPLLTSATFVIVGDGMNVPPTLRFRPMPICAERVALK